MATLAVQNITTAGIAPTYAAATATTGDRFLAADGTFLHVKNGGVASTSVVLTTPDTVDSDLDVEDRTISVPAAGERLIAVPDDLYRASDGLGTVVCTPNTSVTLAVIRI